MKNRFFLSGICGLLLVLCSCGDSPDYPGKQGKVDDTFLNLSRGTESATCTLSSYQLYRNEKGDKKDWKEVSLNGYCGIGSPLPEVIAITEGMTWVRYPFFKESTGPSLIYIPWIAYCRTTGLDKTPYIRTPIQYDEETQTVIINGYESRLVKGDSNEFTLSVDCEYESSDTPFGYLRNMCTYSYTPLDLPSREKMLLFETEHELISSLIEMIRVEFGTEFNLNDYLYPDVILDYPMVNLDDIKSRLLGE